MKATLSCSFVWVVHKDLWRQILTTQSDGGSAQQTKNVCVRDQDQAYSVSVEFFASLIHLRQVVLHLTCPGSECCGWMHLYTSLLWRQAHLLSGAAYLMVGLVQQVLNVWTVFLLRELPQLLLCLFPAIFCNLQCKAESFGGNLLKPFRIMGRCGVSRRLEDAPD